MRKAFQICSSAKNESGRNIENLLSVKLNPEKS